MFKPTKKSNPCAICGDTTGKCRDLGTWQTKHQQNQTLEGHTYLCMTGAGRDLGVRDWHYQGDTKNGDWGKYVRYLNRDGNTDTPHHHHHLAEVAAKEKSAAKAERERIANLPTAEKRDRSFRYYSLNYRLSDGDCADLVRRGLTAADIHQLGAYSTPQGYAVPIRDVDGLMVGAQIKQRDGSYRWLTVGGNKLPDTGELPLAHWSSDAPTLGILCEGTGVKPYLASQKLTAFTIGASGGNHAGSPKTLKRTLDRYPDLPLALAADAGAVTNPQVLRRYTDTYKLLTKWGRPLKVLWWGQVIKSTGLTDRDIDEIDIERFTPQLITWEQFIAIAKHTQALEASVFKGFDPFPRSQPPIHPNHNRHIDREYRNVEDLQNIINYAIAQGYKVVLDNSPTGAGKSTIAGQLDNLEEIDRQWYISSDHRNPSTIEVENNYTDVPSRHQQLYINPYRQIPSGKPYVQTSQPKDANWTTIPGNCNLADLHHQLSAKGYDLEANKVLDDNGNPINPICRSCPQLNACSHSAGAGFGYRWQKRELAENPTQKLRISPQSLVSPEEYNYNQDICIWDDEQFTVSQEIRATLKDFDTTLSQVASYKPAILTDLNPLMVKFRRYFDQLDRAKFGFDHHHLTEGINIDNLSEIIGELEELLTPKFDDILQDADSVDTSNMTAKERHELKWVNDLFKRKSKQDNKNALEELPSNWLIATLKVLDSKQGYLRLDRGQLIVTLPNLHHRNIAITANINLILDATKTPEDIALELGISPAQILVISQHQPTYENLTITQIVGLGNPTKDRRTRQQQGIDAVIDELKHRHQNVGLIDKIRAENVGLWFADSRGSNQYQECDAMVAIGAPVPNLGALAAKFSILVGRQVSPTATDDADWLSYIARQIQAETIQYIGRARAQHRPDLAINMYWICDRADLPLNQIVGAYPGAKFERIEAMDISLDAGTPTQQLRYKIVKAIEQHDPKLTIQQLAQIVGVSKGRLSQLFSLFGHGFKKSLALLVKALYSTTKLFGGHKPSDLTRWEELIEPEVVDYTRQKVASTDDSLEEKVNNVANIARMLSPRQLRALFAGLGRQLTQDFIDLLTMNLVGKVEFIE